MGTTPTFALPYPELTDVANVPADMRELAEAVEGAMGTPTTTPRAFRTKSTNQALTTGGTNYTVTFEVDEGSAGITYSGGVFTITRPGVYQANLTAHLQTGVATTVTFSLEVNASAFARTIVPMSTNTSLALARAVRCVAGDTVQVRLQSTVAGTVVVGSIVRYTSVDITLVAP